MYEFRQTMHKFVSAIIISFITLVGAAPLPSDAEVPPKTAVGGEKIPPSFLNYRPNADDFQKEIRPAIDQLKAGYAISDANNPSRQEKFRSAQDVISKLIESLPRGYRDELYFLRGLADEELYQSVEAINDYTTSLTLRGSNSIALFRRAALFEKDKNLTDAVVGYREVIWRTHGSSYEALYALGNCYQELGDKIKAVRAWEKAYLINASYTPLLRQIITLRKQMIDEAKTPEDKAKYQQQLYVSMQQLNAADPNDPEAALIYAQMLVDHADRLVNRNNMQHAEQIARGISEKSGYKNSAAVRLLATTLIKQQKFDESATVLTKGLKAKPNEPTLLSAQQQLQVERAVRESSSSSSSSSSSGIEKS